jgi:uncharacterized protein (TIGR03435 family)
MKAKPIMSKLAVFCLLGASIGAGKLSATGPEFEVASIRLTPESGKLRQGMTTNGGRVEILGMTLMNLIPLAFRVPQSQVNGPNWMAGQRFDIQARMPPGVPEDQIPEMLQALLADRFKLMVHRQSKEQAVYALVVSKGALKLKPASSEADANTPTIAVDPALPPPTAVVPLGGGQVRLTDDPKDRAGTLSGSRTGTVRMAMGADGTMHLDAPNMSLEGLSDVLTQLLRQPVVDMTGIKGRYQMALEIPRGNVANDAGAAPAQAGGAGLQGVPTASAPMENPIFSAVQKLGLKLESRKMSVEVVVVDHLEKAPTEN